MDSHNRHHESSFKKRPLSSPGGDSASSTAPKRHKNGVVNSKYEGNRGKKTTEISGGIDSTVKKDREIEAKSPRNSFHHVSNSDNRKGDETSTSKKHHHHVKSSSNKSSLVGNQSTNTAAAVKREGEETGKSASAPIATMSN